MRNMRQLINLMEGVMAIPGVGAPAPAGSESDMQDAGTAERNNAYNAFNAAQTPATEDVESEEHSPEVQQALADMENMVMHFHMEPEAAYDRISRQLSPEAVQEFRSALEIQGQSEVDNMDDYIPNDDSYTPMSPDRDPGEDYNRKDFGSDAMEENIELGDHDDAPAWYIYDQQKRICGGPFDSEVDANRASRSYHWFNYGDHEIQPGFDSDGQFVPDDHDEINNSVQEDFNLQNGYDDINDANGNDYFPSGADSPVLRSVGPSGARQGDNPEQKKMQVSEVHKELVYGYRNYLKESDLLNEISKDTLKSYAKKRGQDVHLDQRDAETSRGHSSYSHDRGDHKSAAAWDDDAKWLDNRAEKGAGNIAKAVIKAAKK